MKKNEQKLKFLEEIKKRNAAEKISYYAINLSGMQFSSLDLSNIDFKGGCFAGSRFIRCKISNSSFKAADLSKAVFDNCAIDNADFEIANLKGAEFTRSCLNNIDLRNANLEESNVRDTEIINTLMDGVDFNLAKITNCKFENVKIRGCSFEDTKLSGSVFSNTDLSCAVFKGGEWRRVRFINALLVGSLAAGVGIAKTDFETVDFFKADFRSAYGLSYEIKKNITQQGGLTNYKYHWAGRIIVSTIGLIISVFILNMYLNPAFWPEERIVEHARKLAHKGKYEKAESILNKRLNWKLPQDKIAIVKLALGELYSIKKEPSQAIKIYEEVVNLSKNEWYSLDARSRIAEVSRSQGNLHEAIRTYTELLKDIPSRELWRIHWVRLTIGDINRDSGNMEEAIKLYNIEINNQELGIDAVMETKLRIIDLLQKLNKNEEALKACEESLPKVAQLNQKGQMLLLKADILQRLGKLPEAIKIYEEAANLSKNEWYSLDARNKITELNKR